MSNSIETKDKEATHHGVPAKEACGNARPVCASNWIGVPRLADQVIDITRKALLPVV